MIFIFITILLAYALEAFWLGVAVAVFFPDRQTDGLNLPRHWWSWKRWRRTLGVMLVLAVLATYFFPALSLLDISVSIGHEELRTLFRLPPTLPLIELYHFSLLDLLFWFVEAQLALAVAGWVQRRREPGTGAA